MKFVYLIPLLLLTACASKKPVVVQMNRSVPGTIIPAEDADSIRYGENLKAYTVGRYVEPDNPLVMHERHTVYRVETTAKWNLHPNPAVSVPMGPATRIVDPAHRDPPVNAEVISEVNRQKGNDPNSYRRTETNGGRPQATLRRHRGESADGGAKRAIETGIRREHQTPRYFGAAIARPTKYSGQHTNE